MRIEILTWGAAGFGMESDLFVDRSLDGGRSARPALVGAALGKVA